MEVMMAVLCSEPLCCAVLCCAVLCCAVLCCAVLCCAVLHCHKLSSGDIQRQMDCTNGEAMSCHAMETMPMQSIFSSKVH